MLFIAMFYLALNDANLVKYVFVFKYECKKKVKEFFGINFKILFGNGSKKKTNID